MKYARSGLSEAFTVARRSSMPATSTSESKPLLYPSFIYLLLLSWLPFPFLQCISTIYSLLYLQDTLSRYHRIRLRVSSFYLIVFYLLLTYYCRVFIYNRFVPTIQSLPPYPTEEYLFTTGYGLPRLNSSVNKNSLHLTHHKRRSDTPLTTSETPQTSLAPAK